MKYFWNVGRSVITVIFQFGIIEWRVLKGLARFPKLKMQMNKM
jgi:hypothetical protein